MTQVNRIGLGMEMEIFCRAQPLYAEIGFYSML